jgi:CheY-like chemotaxis protein
MDAHKEILIVDDESGYRNLVNKKLKIAGYHTVLAQNAEEALVALWENERIGLVLLDIRLPMMNGLNIFEIIRKDFPDKKIIVSSALQQYEQRFLMDEAEDYYYKCEDLSTLIEKVDNVFNSSDARLGLRENEKRNSKRMPVNVLVDCERRNRDTFPLYESFISYTKDLSPTGGRFIVSEDIKVGQNFSAAMELPINYFPLLIDCEVVWVRKLEESDGKTKGSMEAGVRFVKLDSPRDEQKLKNYLNCI